MANIKIDFSQKTGAVKPMHGIGQPPIPHGLNFSCFHYLKEAGIPYSRLHDMGGYMGGRFVDIHCVFPDFDADPALPESYDFVFTDKLIEALVENGVEPYWRLGVTIENYSTVKAYHIFPPKDNLKWARICEGIIRHYTEGWADGYRYKIEYWEIWNEPDNFESISENQCWAGTKEQFYELYGVASKYLKERFPHLKIGGYASCGFYAVTGGDGSGGKCSPRHEYFIEFFDGFLDYIKANGCPLDFFSWHTYDGDMNNLRICAEYARRRLDEAGFTETTTSCNEWNCHPNIRGTALHAAYTAAAMITFQNAPLDTACFYDGRMGVGVYGGLFNPMTKLPLPAYYSFVAFNELYKLGSQVRVDCSDADGIYCAAATDGSKGAILVANTDSKTRLLALDFYGRVSGCKLLDAEHNFEDVPLSTAIPPESVLCITVER